MKRLVLISAVCAAGLAQLAHASSDEAWDQFRKDVDAACRDLVEVPDNAQVQVNVDPFGSENYGAALVAVNFGAEGQDVMVCIYDKQRGDAELTGPFTLGDGVGDLPE